MTFKVKKKYLKVIWRVDIVDTSTNTICAKLRLHTTHDIGPNLKFSGSRYIEAGLEILSTSQSTYS